jgi:hypothetical protein
MPQPGGPNPFQGANLQANNPNIPEQYQQGFQVLQKMAQAIKAANPQAPPAVIAAALATGMQQLNPMVRQQATDAFKYIMAGQGQERLNQGQERLDQGAQKQSDLEAQRGIDNERRDKALQARIENNLKMAQNAKDRIGVAKTDEERKAAMDDWKRYTDAAGLAIKQQQADTAEFNAGVKGQGVTPSDETQAQGKKLSDDASKRLGTAAKPRSEDSSLESQGRDKLKSAMGGNDVQGAPVKVQTPEQAAKLPPGTKYVTPDGELYTR